MAEPQKLPSIYGLFDSTGALRYIGKANDPAKRLKGHMRDVRRRRTPLYDWLSKYGEPELRILEASCHDWKEAERRLIAEARARGDRLLNVADGGDEPHCPIETRRANGSKASAVRPKYIMRMYRRLESPLREASHMTERGIEVARANLAMFKDTVAKARKMGRMNHLDNLLREIEDQPEAKRALRRRAV